jgi:hypothetical protein
LTIIFASPPILIHTLDIGNHRPLRETQFIILLGLVIVFRDGGFFAGVFDILFLGFWLWLGFGVVVRGVVGGR